VGINVIDIQTRLTMTVRIEPATEESKKLVEQLRREKKEREDWERQQEQGRLLLGGSFLVALQRSRKGANHDPDAVGAAPFAGRSLPYLRDAAQHHRAPRGFTQH